MVARNLKVFWRDPMTVFFSLVGPLVMVVLFVLFLRKMMVQTIANYLGLNDLANVYGLCDAWMIASVTTMATLSASLGMLTAFVEDRVSGRFSDYLVSPIRRWQLASGYVIAVLAVGLVVALVIFVTGQGWMLMSGQALMNTGQWLSVLGAIALSALTFAAFNTLVVTFTRTQGSYGGLSLVLGTAMGFLSFCYATPQTLDESVTSVLSLLPFAQAAALIRDPALTPAAQALLNEVLPTADKSGDALQDLMESIAARLVVDGQDLTNWMIIGSLSGLTLVFGVLASWRMGRIIR
ncbi:MAG: ABC transporter permease [Propionibacteriaceae bacterium]|nr:ABC transporter permease [Propionibacteriaceae bacterium]